MERIEVGIVDDDNVAAKTQFEVVQTRTIIRVEQLKSVEEDLDS